MHFRRQHRTFFLILCLIIFWSVGHRSWTGSKNKSYDFKMARLPMLSITMKEAQYHVDVLASDEFQGRESGTPGQWLAAKYIAHEFSKYKLLAVGDDRKYYQNFQIEQKDLSDADFWLENVNSDSSHKIVFSLKTDFIPFKFTGENSLVAPVVFAGYGITAPEYKYDDYKNIDVEGKIVLVLRHEPQENDPKSLFDGTRLTKHALFEEKCNNALAHGAAALLLVADQIANHGSLAPRGFWPALNPEIENKPRWQLQKNNKREHFPAFWIGVETAAKILENTGKTIQEMQESIDYSFKADSFKIPEFNAHLNVTLKNEIRKTQNVLALLEGTDPELKKEVLVIGAHYDHVGIKNGHIYHGANADDKPTFTKFHISD